MSGFQDTAKTVPKTSIYFIQLFHGDTFQVQSKYQSSIMKKLLPASVQLIIDFWFAIDDVYDFINSLSL